MKAIAGVLTLAFVFTVGCKNETEKYKAQIEERESKIRALEKGKAEIESTVDELRKKSDDVSKQVSELKKRKERGAVEITNLKWSENEKEFQVILTGTVKNTGLVYLRDVTVKVSLLDETGNPLVVPLINDPYERESETIRMFHYVAESLDVGGSKDFRFVIYTRLMHGDGVAKIRKCIENPKLYDVVGLFVSAK
jgi:hypothetical protein